MVIAIVELNLKTIVIPTPERQRGAEESLFSGSVAAPAGNSLLDLDCNPPLSRIQLVPGAVFYQLKRDGVL